MARVGIIGYGLAGEVFHAPLVDSVDGLEVAAVVTSDAERARRAAAAYPGVQVVARADELWPLVEAVVVAAPNRAHVPLGLAAIERGLPVVMDKPIAPSLADAERLVAAAEATGVLLSVFQNRRWDGDFLTVRRLIERVGEVRRFESRYERWRPELEGGWRQLGDPDEGGGLLLDLGAHLVDQALLLLGPARGVYAELDSRRGGEVDDDTFVAIEHESGARSHLWMSAVAPLHGRRLRVNGADGGIETSDLDPQEDQLAAGVRPGDSGYGLSGASAVVVANAGGERGLHELEAGAYQRFYEGFRDALDGGAPPPVDARDALASLRVIEAARRSHATGSVIAIASQPPNAAGSPEATTKEGSA
jgi:predicted dehydrogenase